MLSPTIQQLTRLSPVHFNASHKIYPTPGNHPYYLLVRIIEGALVQPSVMRIVMSEVRRRGLKPSRSGDWSWSDPLTVGAQGLERITPHLLR